MIVSEGEAFVLQAVLPSTGVFFIKSQSTVALPRNLHSLGPLATDEVLRDTVKGALCIVDSSWNVIAHGDAREGKWRGNWRMQWVASTLHTTSERSVSSISTADAHTSAASSRLNWRPHRFKWTRPFRRKTKSGFCARAITFQTQSTSLPPISLRGLDRDNPLLHLGNFRLPREGLTFRNMIRIKTVHCATAGDIREEYIIFDWRRGRKVTRVI